LKLEILSSSFTPDACVHAANPEKKLDVASALDDFQFHKASVLETLSAEHLPISYHAPFQQSFIAIYS
jgi:hypothetical protein